VSNILSEEVWGRESSRVGVCLTQNLGFCLEKKAVSSLSLFLGFDFDWTLRSSLGVLVPNIFV
jgi:hypothetical protein